MTAVMMKNELVGTWTLKEFANGTAATGFVNWAGPLSGRLIYTSNGIVSVAINRFPPSYDVTEGEKLSFYCGHYKIVGKDSVEHEVLQSSDSTRIGDVYVRRFDVTDNTLTLSGVGLTGDVRLVWTRDT